ncbi:Ion channel [Marinobacter daqiaonensis]|uniref:Ion channel n=1 Tax=Marinobacter daqiaonensis TaxID=650891 RepID=A0A1I6GNX0_9GAMM|nr:ion channel [Marinobacter daqiaonensis]SFR43932.1 Ion channel [Marinobacter daqiaonensis]
MEYIIPGLVLILIVMADFVRTTLTTKGEGPLSSVVSGVLRNLAKLSIRMGHRPSEVLGAICVISIGSVWLAGLWVGWVLVFMGIPDAIAHSGSKVGIGIYDIVYFVGFNLSSLGIGDLAPRNPMAQMATVLTSFSGLLVITLIVTYAISVVGAVVARRVLAFKLYLVGGHKGEFLTEFPGEKEFAAWVGEISKELVSCTEQRLAYPVLDCFTSKDERFSLPVQLAALGIECYRKTRNAGATEPSAKELESLLSVLDRYTSLTGITDDDMSERLVKLSKL